MAADLNRIRITDAQLLHSVTAVFDALTLTAVSFPVLAQSLARFGRGSVHLDRSSHQVSRAYQPKHRRDDGRGRLQWPLKEQTKSRGVQNKTPKHQAKKEHK